MHPLRPAALARVVGAVVLFTAAAALAVCGDGVLQVGETCDASASGGDAACPDACIPHGLAGQCSCAQPSEDPRRFVLIANGRLQLGTDTLLIDGHVAVVRPVGSMNIGKDVQTPSSSQAISDLMRVHRTARIGRVFARLATIKQGAVLAGGGPFPFTAPIGVLDGLPPFPAVAAGTTPVHVALGETLVLPPGSYGDVIVEQDATLILRGLSPGSGAGTYVFAAVRLGFNARIETHNPVVVEVVDNLVLSGLARLAPSSLAPLVGGDLQVNVHGKRVSLGRSTTVTAYVRAPIAKARLGKGAFLSGRIIAGQIATRAGTLTLQGACGDGALDPGEQCDASAPSGDVACPGACIAGDPQGKGRIALGQPGQCTCRCASNADCDDANACNGVETCVNNVCVLGVAPDCRDDNPCTRDCDATLGCVNAPVTNGTTCNDGNPCTTSDSCQNGACTPGTPVLDGTSCSDQNKCTTADSCQAGTCTGGPPRDCSDDNTCSIDTCDPIAGCQHTLLSDGDPCNDKNVCTLLDRCQSGTCVGTDPKNCDDGNPCTTESCDATNGCLHTALPDGTVCAAGKTCHGGFCS